MAMCCTWIDRDLQHAYTARLADPPALDLMEVSDPSDTDRHVAHVSLASRLRWRPTRAVLWRVLSQKIDCVP